MLQDIQIHEPGQSRGATVKKVAYEMEKVFAEAQTMESRVLQHSTEISMDGGNFKLVPRSKKRAYTRRNFGITRTPDSGQTWRAPRAIFIQEFHDALQVDVSDLIDTYASITETAKTEQRKAMARTIDQILLDALITTVEEGSDGATNSTTQRITASAGLTTRYRDLVRAKISGKDADATLDDFEADDLEDINYSFISKNVEDELCVTLTPELARVLRKDSDFKNAENIYSLQSAPDRRAGFTYKDFRFVPVRPDVLPLLQAGNLTSTANANGDTLDTAKILIVKDIADTSARATNWTSTRVTVPASSNTTGYSTVEAKSKDMIYIWSPNYLLRATRDQLNMFSEDTRLDASLAKQIYSRINLGAVFMDDEFVLAVPLAGTVKRV